MVREVELPITAGQVVLRGVLALPDPAPASTVADARWPSVLLLSSLLPRDADGRLDRRRHRGWFAPPRRDEVGILARVAAALAARGVASLRYDKRGCGSSGGDWASAGLFTLVDDARDAIAALRGHEVVEASRIGILGHGEGGWLALSAAAADPGIGPLTLVGTPARGLRDVLRRAAAERGRRRVGPHPEPAHLFVAAFDRGLEELIERADRGEPEITLYLGRGRRVHIGLSMWEQAMHIPTRALATLQQRSVTIVHGQTDVWVDPDEASLLAAALADTAAPSMVLVPGAGHELAEAPNEVFRDIAADFAARLQPRRLPTVLLSIGLR